MTDPLGANRSLNYTTIFDVVRLVGADQPAGSGCAASTSNQTFDANANVASRDDFNGARVCFASDLSRNLETTRVEGLSNATNCSAVIPAASVLPAGSRKVSSQWHPDWRLAVKVAEPKTLTTNVYNGQPDPFAGNTIASCAPSGALLPDGKPIVVLCKKVEQATADGNGSQGLGAALDASVPVRVWANTYNQYGQVLTATDPLNHTTSYVYYADTSFTGVDPNAMGHTIGDLQTVTNAAGHVTSYTLYDKHGQVLQSTNPNGLTTTNTYDLRQRLLSTSVGGQTTAYVYDAVGQLTQVTLPDSAILSYSYDDAQRLTGVTDAAGNTITYTLDNAGNKTAEVVKDAGGALARNISRVFDALGRVQQVSGAAQ